jgi:biopolymer transport protein ExbD
MAQQQTTNDESLSEVNVIPLADLSLVLLIILMVLSPMITQSLIQVQSAQASAAQTAQEFTQPETPLIVSYAPGMLKFNGVVMQSPLDFVTEMDRILPTRKDKSIILTAAPDLTHGDVVSLMNVIQHHGVDSLTLVKWDPLAVANIQPIAQTPVRGAKTS